MHRKGQTEISNEGAITTLTLKKTRDDDSGTYKCTFTSKLGKFDIKFSVKVEKCIIYFLNN